MYLFLGLIFQPAFADVSLPSIGQESNFLAQKEKEIGRRFYNQLSNANKIINDPLVNFYLKEVTSILLQSLDNNYRDFKVSIIDDSAINAFAVPGGYIGINYGLVLAAETEAQFAGVLSHEISHIVLNHLFQLLEKQNATNTAMVASLLMALVVSQKLDSDSKGEAVEALVFGGTAGIQQTLINFTRENEYEADRKGLELMKKAGYPAIGMAEFFSLLEGEGGSGEISSIEYLRTHPVSANRMGEAYQLRAKKIFDNKNKSLEYELFKVYLNSLVDGSYKSLNSHSLIVQFEKGLYAAKSNKHIKATNILENTYQNNKENLWVIYSLIKMHINNNEYAKALVLINNGLNLYPKQSLLVSQKIKVLMFTQGFDMALKLALEQLSQNEDNQEIRSVLVSIYDELDLTNKARETEGDYMLKQGNLIRAKYLYQHVLSHSKNSRDKQELKEKIAKVERLEITSKELDN